MKYLVIQHPTRGYYVGHDLNDKAEWKPKFRWSIEAYHDDVERFHSKEQAQKALDEIAKTAPKVAKSCSFQDVETFGTNGREINGKA